MFFSCVCSPNVASSLNGSGFVAREPANAIAYKIGDTGPAGGIVFYDKGNRIGGWRYLEAAPEETETAATINHTNYNELCGSRRAGDGKENTKKFIALFQRIGGGINTAPWLCNELDVNDYDDWYLPTTDELMYMYNNLYLKGIGGLKSARYWSSYIDGWWRLYCIDFLDGSEQAPPFPSGLKYQVRAIRQF